MNYVKLGWNKIKKEVKKITKVYSLHKVKKILLTDNFYKELYGKSRNRTLLKKDKKLFKSIYFYSKILETTLKNQNTHKGSYNFAKRVKFIVEYNCKIEKLKCQCGKKYNWTKYCRFCPNYHKTFLGKTHSEVTKQHMRIGALRYLAKTVGQIQPRYNVNSIDLIENYGKNNGYNFQHAENGGEYYIKELGYFVDAYDKEKNIVLEVDEPVHYKNGKLCKKDILRQKQIKKFLGCKFIRLKI